MTSIEKLLSKNIYYKAYHFPVLALEIRNVYKEIRKDVHNHK